MATSGSINYAVTRDDIIEEALMILQAIPEGGAPSSDQLTDHSRTLNNLVKSWMARGIKLFCLDRVTLFLEQDRTEYVLGTQNATLSSDVVRTTIGAAEAAGQTALTVSSITGISNGDFIGIELDDGTMQWTTVNGAPSGTTVTVTTALTGAAAAGNQVYSYTTKYARGAKYVMDVFRRDFNLKDSPINIISRQEYNSYGDKYSEGAVTSMWVDSRLSGLALYTYPETDSSTDTLEFVALRTLEDFDSASDNPDFPQEYYRALSWGLAAELSSMYGKSLSERGYFDEKAERILREVEGLDREQEVSMQITPQNGL